MRINSSDLRDHLQKRTASRPKARARGTHTPGAMNKLEAEYAAHLEALRAAGEILWWAFEPCKFRLADRTFYTPDFGIVTREKYIEYHETKGFWQDDARVKIKVAAETYWFLTFRAIQKAPKRDGGGWKVETFGKETA